MLGACRSRRGEVEDRNGCSSARVRVVVVVVVEEGDGGSSLWSVER